MLGSPPLAALHSMTEMKQAMLQYSKASGIGSTSFSNTASGGGGVGGGGGGGGGNVTPTSSGTTSPVASSIPHGIDSILNRPSPGQLAFGPRLAASGVYLNGSLGKPQLGEFGRPSPLAWPGLQGMIQNPVFWRERFSGQSPGVYRSRNRGHGSEEQGSRGRRSRGHGVGAEAGSVEFTRSSGERGN